MVHEQFESCITACNDCADACRRCAEACRQMSGQGQKRGADRGVQPGAH